MLEKRELTMLYMIALAYWLLCVRLRVQLEAFFAEGKGGAEVSVSALGMQIRRAYTIVQGEQAFSLRLKPQKGKKHRKPKNSMLSNFVSRMMKNVLRDGLRSKRFESISLRLALGDACETAIAAGAAHALLCALLAGTGAAQSCRLRVTPVFDAEGLHAHVSGIFFCQPGDIMLAALTALRKRARD